MAPVVGEGGGNVEAPGPMTGPRGTNLGWVMGDDKLSCGVEGGRRNQGYGHGSRANGRRWFSVSWAKGKRVFQRLAGKEKCVVERVAMRWFFAVRMERSAGLVRWVKGGTCWKATWFRAKKAES